MLLSTLVSHTNEITRRSDLQTATEQAIKKTLLKLHTKDDWKQDLKISTFNSIATAPITNDGSKITVDTGNATYFPRIRKISGLVGSNNIQYTEKSAMDMQDQYSVDRWNCFYKAGTAVVIVPYTLPSGVTVMWHQYPDVSQSNISSWIADLFPYEVAGQAAAEIFKLVGKDDEAAKYRQDYAEFLQLLYATGGV